MANPNYATAASCCQDADHSFNGIIILKVLPKLLVAFLMKTGLYRLFFSCFKYTSVTLQQTLDGLTDNQDLKTVLSYICGDYGVYSYKILEAATSSVYGFIEQQKMEDRSLLLIQNLSLKPSLTKRAGNSSYKVIRYTWLNLLSAGPDFLPDNRHYAAVFLISR